MNFEIDKTDHNRFAEQFAARLREEAVEHSVSQIAAFEAKARGETTKKSRRAAPVTEIIEVAPPPAPLAPFSWPTDSALEVIDCEQNSPEWQLARIGIPTASSFDAIMTPGKTKTEQKTRRTYMLKLAGEILTGKPMEMVMTRDMERGHLLEPEARDLYQLQTKNRVERIGFLRRGPVGCSPDSLIGQDGGLEIKTKAPHLLIDIDLKGEFPEEHQEQVQGALWITGRQWWDIAIYWPGLPLFVKRAFRDEAYIATLAAEVDRFNTELDSIVAQMRQRIELRDALPFAAAA